MKEVADFAQLKQMFFCAKLNKAMYATDVAHHVGNFVRSQECSQLQEELFCQFRADIEHIKAQAYQKLISDIESGQI